MPDEKKEEMKENVLNENCLVGGKEYSKGTVVDFEDKVIDDLKAAGRICKTEDEQKTAKAAKKAADKSAKDDKKDDSK